MAILLLGGNLGNREAYLRFALFHLKKNVGKVLQMSKVYESGAWGKEWSLGESCKQAFPQSGS